MNGRNQKGWGVLSQSRDELFGVAILSIIIFHYFENALDNYSNMQGSLAMLYNRVIGSIGVEGFILLSGIGLCFSMKKQPDIGQFYGKRMKRILIPYLICGVFFWVIKDMIITDKGMTGLFTDLCFVSFFHKGNKNLLVYTFYSGSICSLCLSFVSISS